MSLANQIKEINETAQKNYGIDISVVVVRAIAFGNDDNLVIVSGKNHAKAALDFSRVIPKATITEVVNAKVVWPDGWVVPEHTVSHIQF